MIKKFGNVTVTEDEGKIEVSWASIGGVSIEDADKFGDDLKNAIVHAKYLSTKDLI